MTPFALHPRPRALSGFVNQVLGPGLVVLASLAAAAPQILPLTALSTFGYDPLDAHLNLWNFWWTKQAIGGPQDPYWTSLLLYPAGASLALHTYPMPYALISVPIQYLLDGPAGLVAAFNVVVGCAFVMSALGAYCLILRLTESRPAAIVCAVAFAWMPYRMLNVPRLSLVATEFIVWYVLLWIRFVERPSRGRALAAGVVLALTLYTSAEYALYCVGFTLLWIGWFLVWQRRAMPALPWRRVLVAPAVAVLLASPLLAVQSRAFLNGEIRPARPIGEAVDWSPALVSFFTPSRLHPVYGSALAFAGEYGDGRTIGMRTETTIGLTIWGLVMVALTRLKPDRTAFWAFAAAAFLILALGPVLRITGTWTTGIPLPYAVLHAVFPPLRASRDPTRLFPVAMLMLTVLAGFGVRACLARISRAGVAMALTAVLIILVIFESAMVRAGKIEADALIDPAYRQIAATPGNFTVIDLSLDQEALSAQTLHGHAITAGSVSIPRASAAGQMTGVERDFRDAERVLALDGAAWAARLDVDRQELDRLHIRFVVVPEAAPAQRELARLLGLREHTRGRDRLLFELPAIR
ncbi:MAG TPA: hypothetical protein VFV78_01365 [Vicinamibacterales bacterium]|nr:hypothetical protein [Vicinamibacterales bacterium]